MPLNMTDLNDEKLRKEIALLEMNKKVAKATLYFDVLKTIAILVGGAILFWFIQQPESIVNRTASKETIARERAKLMLDVIKETDPQKQADVLSVIRSSYGESDDEWIRSLESRIRSQAQSTTVKVLLHEYDNLLKQREILKIRQDEELRGIGPSGKAGIGPRYAEIRTELASTNFQIEKIIDQLLSLGFDTTTIEK